MQQNRPAEQDDMVIDLANIVLWWRKRWAFILGLGMVGLFTGSLLQWVSAEEATPPQFQAQSTVFILEAKHSPIILELAEGQNLGATRSPSGHFLFLSSDGGSPATAEARLSARIDALMARVDGLRATQRKDHRELFKAEMAQTLEIMATLAATDAGEGLTAATLQAIMNRAPKDTSIGALVLYQPIETSLISSPSQRHIFFLPLIGGMLGAMVAVIALLLAQTWSGAKARRGGATSPTPGGIPLWHQPMSPQDIPRALQRQGGRKLER